MILPDVNVLIYAFYEPGREHAVYADWLNRMRAEGEELLLLDTVLLGFIRIVTSSRVFEAPASTAQAMAFVTALRGGAGARSIMQSDSVWRAFSALIDQDRHVQANLVPDAYIAAVAISHKAAVATRDRGYARFPGLRWFDPAQGLS